MSRHMASRPWIQRVYDGPWGNPLCPAKTGTDMVEISARTAEIRGAVICPAGINRPILAQLMTCGFGRYRQYQDRVE